MCFEEYKGTNVLSCVVTLEQVEIIIIPVKIVEVIQNPG